MAKSKLANTAESTSPVLAVREAADAMCRAALECSRQHDRISKVLGASTVEDEVTAAIKQCEMCDDTLRSLSESYERTASGVKPTGEHEEWWHRANALWLASREFLRRQGSCDANTRETKRHGPDRLSALQTEYELEASALLLLRQAAEAYKRDRPTAA